MAKLSDLLAQQEKLRQQIIEASNDELNEIMQRLNAISEATGKSVPELLNLQADKKSATAKGNDAKSTDPEWTAFKKDNDGKTFTVDGKSMTLKNKGPNNQKLMEAWKAGNLQQAEG